jgi:hypothetical protein
MRTCLGVDALVGQTQALDRSPGDQMLGNNLLRVFRLDVPIPDSFGVDHDRRTVFALVKAAGFVDADFAAQTSRFRKLLELRNQVALAVRCAGWTGSAFGANVLANENMAFKGCQTRISSRVHGTGLRTGTIPQFENDPVPLPAAMPDKPTRFHLRQWKTTYGTR